MMGESNPVDNKTVWYTDKRTRQTLRLRWRESTDLSIVVSTVVRKHRASLCVDMKCLADGIG